MKLLLLMSRKCSNCDDDWSGNISQICKSLLQKYKVLFPRLSKTKEMKVSEISLTDTEITSLLFSASFRQIEHLQDRRNSDIFFSKDSPIRNDHIRYDPAEQQPGSIIHVQNLIFVSALSRLSF